MLESFVGATFTRLICETIWFHHQFLKQMRMQIMDPKMTILFIGKKIKNYQARPATNLFTRYDQR